MADISFKLTDKTALLAGNFNLCMQSIASKLTEAGANVVLLTNEPKMAERYCQSLSDLREVSEQHGRAIVLESALYSEEKSDHYFSKTAETFGTADIYVDLTLYNFKLPPFCKDIPKEFQDEFQRLFLQFQNMTSAAAKFLRSRSRGRIIVLLHELDMQTCEGTSFSGFDDFQKFLTTQASEIYTPPNNTSFNAVAVGTNEEYLITRFPKSRTIQESLKELRQSQPQARLVEHNDVSNLILYLASPLSSGLNGQILRLNHGLAQD